MLCESVWSKNTFNWILIIFRWTPCRLPRGFMHFFKIFKLNCFVVSHCCESAFPLQAPSLCRDLVRRAFSVISFDISTWIHSPVMSCLSRQRVISSSGHEGQRWEISLRWFLSGATELFSESGPVFQIAGGTNNVQRHQLCCTRTFPAFGGDAGNLIFEWHWAASSHLSRWHAGL